VVISISFRIPNTNQTGRKGLLVSQSYFIDPRLLPAISREEAEELLQSKVAGSFLVRKKALSSLRAIYVLSVVSANR